MLAFGNQAPCPEMKGLREVGEGGGAQTATARLGSEGDTGCGCDQAHMGCLTLGRRLSLSEHLESGGWQSRPLWVWRRSQ